MATRKIRYVGPFAEGVEIADTGQWVQQNHQVEVDEDVEKLLLEQKDNWEKVDPPKGGK